MFVFIILNENYKRFRFIAFLRSGMRIKHLFQPG